MVDTVYMEPESSLRERLIDVGVDIVMTDGPASLGLREIARRAGVSHGAPRRYFPTHHALLSAIARRGFADLASRFEAAADEGAPPRDRLRTLARTYLRYASEHRGMFELMFRHDLLDSEAQPSDLPPLRDSTLPLFSHLVELVSRHAAERDGRAGRASRRRRGCPVDQSARRRPVGGLGQSATRPGRRFPGCRSR